MTSSKEKCPYSDCFKVHYHECEVHGSETHEHRRGCKFTPKTDEGKGLCKECGSQTGPCHKHKAVEGWKEEFDDLFCHDPEGEFAGILRDIGSPIGSKDIKQFIASLILKAKEEERERILALFPKEYREAHQCKNSQCMRMLTCYYKKSALATLRAAINKPEV